MPTPSVRLIRELNQLLYGGTCDDLLALYCPACRKTYSSDLARYWCPEDKQIFTCSECDGTLCLKVLAGNVKREELPLTQRETEGVTELVKMVW